MIVTGILKQQVELELPDSTFDYPIPEAIPFTGVDEMIVDLTPERIEKFTHYPDVMVHVVIEGTSQMEPYESPYKINLGPDDKPSQIIIPTKNLTGVIIIKR